MSIDQNNLIDPDCYQLIDFGDGRKLESIAGHIVDRPSPAAATADRQSPGEWSKADARFDPLSKTWTHHRPWPADLDVDCGTFRMPVAATPFGHIGLFPEQSDNWKWLSGTSAGDQRQHAALNLFAYTGASSLALITAGYQVTHVDAAKANVQAARQAAAHNGWGDAAIRYLVDDAAKFVARELRRGRSYHTIVLDPPTYGHSPQGKTWRIERDLWPLLEDCLRLLDPAHFRLLITGHSAHVDQNDVGRFLQESRFWRNQDRGTGMLLASGRSQLVDRKGRALDAGFFVRASSRQTT